MKLITTQVALFSKDLISRPDKMKDEIEQKMGGSIFDAMPLILNLPVDAPSDLPVVQAKSVSGRYALNISRMRIDYFVIFGAWLRVKGIVGGQHKEPVICYNSLLCGHKVDTVCLYHMDLMDCYVHM